jgi:hypothetical protein
MIEPMRKALIITAAVAAVGACTGSASALAAATTLTASFQIIR